MCRKQIVVARLTLLKESGADYNLFSSHRLIVLMVGRVSNLHMSQRVRDHMQHNAASRAEVKRLCLLSIVRRESCRAIVQYVLLPGRQLQSTV